MDLWAFALSMSRSAPRADQLRIEERKQEGRKQPDSGALRSGRARRHKAGDHSLCLPGRCADAGTGWPTEVCTCVSCGSRTYKGRSTCTKCQRAQIARVPCWICRSSMPDRPRRDGHPPTCSSCTVRHGAGVCTECGGPKRLAGPGLCRGCYGSRHPQRPKAAPGICKLCAESYVPKPKARPDQSWCSKSCAQAWRNGARPPYTRVADGDGDSQKMARNRLRLRVRAQTWDGITNEQILERDRWRCGICGKRIGKSFKYPHPRSKSVDHVIPLSQGGDDTAANRRAAHLVCNQGRMNRGGGEQLAMIG